LAGKAAAQVSGKACILFLAGVTATFKQPQFFEWALFALYLFATCLVVLETSFVEALPSSAFASIAIFNFSNLARLSAVSFGWFGLCRKHYDQL